MPRCLRHQFVQDSQLLAEKLVGERDSPGDVAARTIEACDRALFHRVQSIGEHDRNRIGRVFRCTGCKSADDGRDHAHLSLHQIRGQLGQAGHIVIRKAILDRKILALDIAGILQALTKASQVPGGCSSERE